MRAATLRLVRRGVALGLGTALALGPGPARADGTADEADLHFRMGSNDFRRGDFEGALAHFLLSNRLVPNRNVVFNVATAYERLGRPADAHRYYVEALTGEADPRAVEAVRTALGRLAPSVALLDVTTDPPGAPLYVDRRDLGSHGRSPRPLALAAGRYRILAELEGYEPESSEIVEATLGSAHRVSLTLRRVVGTVHVTVEGARAATVRVGDEEAPPACVAPCPSRRGRTRSTSPPPATTPSRAP